MNKSNLAHKPSRLQQLLDKRRAELKNHTFRDSYVESVRVDFVAVLERNFNLINKGDAA